MLQVEMLETGVWSAGVGWGQKLEIDAGVGA